MEEAAVATLHPSVITTSTRCHGCLSAMPSDVDPDSIFNCVDCAGQSCFCSAACMQRATPEWHKVLCPKSSENPAAQKLWDYCVEVGLSRSLSRSGVMRASDDDNLCITLVGESNVSTSCCPFHGNGKQSTNVCVYDFSI